MPSTFQLVTDRLILRPWQDRDRAPFAAMTADPQVMRYFAAPLTRAQAEEAVDRYMINHEREGFTMFVAECRASGNFLGHLGLQTMSFVVPAYTQPQVEIGWRLTRAAQGRGYATEGAQAVLDHAFSLHIPQVVAVTIAINQPSRHVMEKLGMVHQSAHNFIHPRVPAGHPFAEHLLYSIANPTLKQAPCSTPS